MSNEPTRTASSATTPPSEMTATSLVPPPMSTTMLPSGSWIGQRRADRRGHRLLDEERLRRAGTPRRFEHRALLDVGDGRRHADQHPRTLQARDAGALEQHADEALGDLEVGDRTAAQRTDRDDVAGGATDHLPGVVAEREHLVGARVHGDDGRLVEDDPLAARVDERVGGAEVDGEVAGQGTLLSRPRGRSRAPVPQSEPPSQCSRFQIGTVSFRVSMQNRAASNASARCGDDTTTTTATSDSARSPVRCSERDPVDRRPLAPGVGRHRGEPRDRLLLVRLVGEAGARRRALRRGRARRRGTRRPRHSPGWSPTRWRRRPGGRAGDVDPVAGGGRLHGAIVVKAASRAPCGHPGTGRCGRPKPLVGGDEADGREPSVHSAPCAQRKPEVMARPNPTTRRADLLRTLSTGPGCTPASCASFASHTERAAARAPAPRMGDRCRFRGRRGARHHPRAGRVRRPRRPSPLTAAHRRSSPTPATWSTTPSPSGSAPRWRRASSIVRTTHR